MWRFPFAKTRWRISFVLVGSLSWAACGRELSPADRRQWHADSAQYLVQLHAWERDSTVVDSLVRISRADSIRTLYDKMIRSVAPMQYPQLIECERQRIEDRYGPRVAYEVQRRAQRDAASAATPRDIELMNRRLPRGMGVEVMGDACGRRYGTGPDSIAGVSMQDSPPTPVPPRHPR
jgi:hypothetical protein